MNDTINDTQISMETLVQELLALPVDKLLLFFAGLPSTLLGELFTDRRITVHMHRTLENMDQGARKSFSEFLYIFQRQIRLPIDQAETIERLEKENAYLREKVLTGVPLLDKLHPSL